MLKNNATLTEVEEYKKDCVPLLSTYKPTDYVIISEWIKLRTNLEELAKLNFTLANTLNNLTNTHTY